MKPGVLTSEFWALLVLVIMYVLKAWMLPDLDEAVFIALLGWIGLRQGTKVVNELKKNGSTLHPPLQ